MDTDLIVRRLSGTGISEVRAIILVEMLVRFRDGRATADHAIAALEEAGWPARQAETIMSIFQNFCAERESVRPARSVPQYPNSLFLTNALRKSLLYFGDFLAAIRRSRLLTIETETLLSVSQDFLEGRFDHP